MAEAMSNLRKKTCFPQKGLSLYKNENSSRRHCRGFSRPAVEGAVRALEGPAHLADRQDVERGGVKGAGHEALGAEGLH